jgi:SSS family solute:Na+ symporter
MTMQISQVGYISLWILAILIPVQLIIGAVMAKKSGQSAAHYFISGKQLPLILVFFADFATVMGVGNFIGYAGKGYQIGLGQLWMMFGEQGSKVVFAFLIAGMAGRYAYNTINEFMDKEMYHDKWLRAISGFCMTVPEICTVGAQAIGIGSLLAVVLGIDPTTGIWVASLTAIAYTVMGGMWAIAWTDLLQGIIRVAVGFVFFGVVYWSTGGLGGIQAAVTSTKPELWSMGSIGVGGALAIFLGPLCGQFTTQAWWQRSFSAKDQKTAQRGFLYSAVFAIVMCTCSIMVGMAAYTLNPNFARPDMAFPWLLTNYLNPVLSALLVVTIVGADMTVSAGRLNGAVTLLLMDVIKPIFRPSASEAELVRIARWLTLVGGIGSVAVAFSFPTVLSALLFGYVFIGGGMFLPLVLGLWWKDKNGKTYVTKNAALASLVLGGGTAAVIQGTPSLMAMIGGGIVPGLCVSFVFIMGITWLERTSAKYKLDPDKVR